MPDRTIDSLRHVKRHQLLFRGDCWAGMLDLWRWWRSREVNSTSLAPFALGPTSKGGSRRDRTKESKMNRRPGASLKPTFILMLMFSVLSAHAAAAQDMPSGTQLSPMQRRIFSGLGSFALDPNSTGEPPVSLVQGGVALGQLTRAVSGLDPTNPANYTPGVKGDCGFNTGSNVKVNQDCLNVTDSDLQGRGQAQDGGSIAQDPNSPDHLVAGFNDYRRGDQTCGAAV